MPEIRGKVLVDGPSSDAGQAGSVAGTTSRADLGAELAYVWGIRLRRGRLRAGRTQLDIATEAGVSRSMVCRMELGRGAGYPLSVWAAVADAAGLELASHLRDEGSRPFGADEVRRLAAAGRWSPTDSHLSGSGAATIVVLEREPAASIEFGRPALRTGALAAIIVADVVTDLARMASELRSAIDAERRSAPTGWSVGGAIVVRATASNRRRVRRRLRYDGLAHPPTASRWIAALIRDTAPMPATIAMVWLSADGRRLTPPWLHLRTPRAA
jgi:transcriptional regulator with XRE-family HTH domain